MKTIIAIMSCNRLDELKKNIVPYLQFIKVNSAFDFVVSLDGYSKEYIEFCSEISIPLIYSKDREGVGISRNRVVKLFPEHDYYFFIDDDVELVDSSIFQYTIDLSIKYQINHFSPAHTVKVLNKIKIDNDVINCSEFGGGYFLMYTKKALDVVGGWHIEFAKYKRFGHTEHTYRVYKNGLNKHPFMFTREMRKKILLNTPVSVSSSINSEFEYKENLVLVEFEMVQGAFTYSPFSTISDFFYLEHDISLMASIGVEDRYYFLSKNAQKHAYARYFYQLWKVGKNPIYFLYSLKSKNTIKLIKHLIKVKVLTILINYNLIKNEEK